MRGLRAVARVAVPAVAAGALACAEPAWDAARLEQRHPALARLEGHRLADLRPFYWPAGDRLTLLLCIHAAGEICVSDLAVAAGLKDTTTSPALRLRPRRRASSPAMST